MKIWIDDMRQPPNGYVWCKTTNNAINTIVLNKNNIEVISIDHDAGEYAYDGGDFIKVLDWLESIGKSYPIHIHSMNPVGVQNMRAIIKRNNWIEIR